ncbi:MAG: hypothetical protein IPO35_07650 [Uliginosibacterium sp.]|nr:hypothetical protein [Uliginosibacterium sp.]
MYGVFWGWVALPCVYWYIRSYFISGNPFHPFASDFFGYWNWDRVDVELQLFDVKRIRDWPDYVLFLSVGGVAGFLGKERLSFGYIFVFCVYAFLSWYFTTHYSRYLVFAYPFFAVLIGCGGGALFKILASLFGEKSVGLVCLGGDSVFFE